VLHVHNLVTCHGQIQVLQSVSLHANQGEIVSIIGANGAGKSTLLGTLAGWYKPKSGEIVLYGNPITGLATEKVVRKGLCLVPEGRQIFASLTVRENLVLGMYQHYFQKRQQVNAKIEMILEMFPGLKKHINNLGGNLSGGEQQMLAIGRGLMSEPKIILLDEPSMGLSPIIVAEIVRILRQIRDELGTTVILVEQNVKAALKIADRAYVMERGEFVLEGRASELLTNPLVQSAYLGKGHEGRDSNR
jgi:branched-chain amino acid transport system ATP-binding protein